MQMASLEKFSCAGKNYLPPTSEICSPEGNFKEIPAKISFQRIKFSGGWQIYEKQDAEDRRQTNKCHPDEKITTQKANAIATTIKKRAGGQLLNTSPPPEILREAGNRFYLF
ncbi:MAG: hypothetical protein PUG18_02670 [Lachnospiraceae bacterium]|nr:hypothetical protein [Lachnospiraceae bacterium]